METGPNDGGGVFPASIEFATPSSAAAGGKEAGQELASDYNAKELRLVDGDLNKEDYSPAKELEGLYSDKELNGAKALEKELRLCSKVYLLDERKVGI